MTSTTTMIPPYSLEALKICINLKYQIKQGNFFNSKDKELYSEEELI